MSLVGPRMITVAELPEWGAAGQLLLSVRPGLTGLWQVSGRQLLSKAERIRLDAGDVRRMSLRLDLTILPRTLFVVVSGHGAYCCPRWAQVGPASTRGISTRPCLTHD